MLTLNDTYIELLEDRFKATYLQYVNKQPLDGDTIWGSHQPVLIHALNTIREGSVLECGMGDYSTPLMHFLCKKLGRQLISVVNDSQWFNKFIHYHSDKHEMILFKDDLLVDKHYDFLNSKYSVAFVDVHATMYLESVSLRQFLVRNVNADYIVVHDTETVVNCVKSGVFTYDYDFSSFRHVLHFKELQPMTSVLSNLETIDEHLLTIFK